MIQKDIKMSIILITVVYICFSVCGQILFKYGANKNLHLELSNGVFSLTANIYSIVGILMYIVSFILFLVVISRFEISYIYPIIVGCTYVLIFLCAALILKEKIEVKSVIGSALIIIGVMLISLQKVKS